MRHIPRKLCQNNLCGIGRSGSEYCVIITPSEESELMFKPVNDFVIVITEPKDVFQWNSERKCSFRVQLLNDITLSNFESNVVLEMSRCV